MKKRVLRHKLALLIPAHNEELVIFDTITSAMSAGQSAEHIYLVDDNSSDRTAAIARKLLGKKNVLTVERSGKAKAIDQAVKHFCFVKRYRWIHIADADGVFASNYFAEFTKPLKGRQIAAATGYIMSLPGGWISKYRSYEYATGLEITRRAQNLMGVIPVIPGPTSCFRSDIFHKLDFDVDSLTEDFDITLQIHRKRLGKIVYIRSARTYTQDPRTFKDYLKQIERWYRGNFQAMVRHKIGAGFQSIDAYLAFVLLEQFLYAAELVTVPLMAWFFQSYLVVAVSFLTDLAIFFGLTLMSASVNRRADIVASFPLFYVLRSVNLFVFLKSFLEVVVLKRFRSKTVGWATEGRRYRIPTEMVLTTKKGA